MNIPRVDTAALRTLADLVRVDADLQAPYDEPREIVRRAADRIDVLDEALRVVLQEAIPSGSAGPYMLTRATLAKIACVWSPGIEVLRRIAMKSEKNHPITGEDVAEALSALKQVESGEQDGG